MEILKNKWVLYGGGAIAVIGAFLLFRGGGSDSAESEPVQSSNFSPLAGLTYGMAPLSTGYTVSDTQESALPSFDATRELLMLENKKADNDFELQSKLADQAQALGLYRQTSNEKIALDTNDTTRYVTKVAATSQIVSDFIKNAKLKKTKSASVAYDGSLVTLARA